MEISERIATTFVSIVPSAVSAEEQPADRVGKEIAAKFEDDASELVGLLAYCDEHSLIEPVSISQRLLAFFCRLQYQTRLESIC